MKSIIKDRTKGNNTINNTMKVRIKKLHEDAIIPKYAKEGDVGLDLTAISVNQTDQYLEYGTGIAIQIPEGYGGFIFPRSSITNYGLMMKNSVGVVDQGYRGELKIRFTVLERNYQKVYNIGDRIAQLVILPTAYVDLIEVNELSDSER